MNYLNILLLTIILSANVTVSNNAIPFIGDLKAENRSQTTLPKNSTPDNGNNGTIKTAQPDKYRKFVTGANYVSMGLNVLLSVKALHIAKNIDPYTVLYNIIIFNSETFITNQQSANSNDSRKLYTRNGIFLAINAFLSYVFASSFTNPSVVKDMPIVAVNLPFFATIFAVKAAVNLINVYYKATQPDDKK